ncbi:hypothetical protein IMZ08_02675 [Bacillus luteolus]|uniref:DUF4083 domain-containing protein n=2 Tax=Litchfieldia luteola TaxID=682179 RepID=A0ABR9QEW9_9BACI|nr:hypothetical protein [Cytobacillus luteolus]
MMTLLTAQAYINGGDILFQLFAFMVLLVIPIILVVFIFTRKRNSRLARIEEKLDKLLKGKDQ